MPNVELYRRARAVFVAAIERPPAQRAQLLEAECAGDAALRSEVESLLAAHEAEHGFGSVAAQAPAAMAPPLEVRRLPERIGNYRILDLLGEGGMGVVYLAEQDNPRRTVALKVLNGGGGSAARIRRFEREAQLLGRLHHPGIAQVYEAGTADAGAGPQPYLAMELVEGRELTEHADARGLDTRARVELLVQVCLAVHHAHERRIIHRDLKPANILVDEHGTPKVLDFGIAHASAEDLRSRTLLTGAGEVLGTLPYMSPEQIEGDPALVDARSDVYALGVIAYRLLSGRLPLDFGRGSLPEAARAIREEEPPFLGTLQRELRGDLETIVAKALAKERERRYGSALELAQDLGRWLRQEPIVARPPSTIYQLVKFARRNRVLFFGMAGVFVALILGIAGTSWQALRATDEKKRALEAKGVADKATEAAQRETRRVRSTYKFIDDMLMAADPKQLGREVKVVDVLDAMASKVGEQFKDDEASEATVRHTIGVTYWVLGMRAEADLHLRRSLELHRKVFGESDPATARAEYSLGRATMSMGNLDEAQSLFREALAGFRAAGGPEDSESLTPRLYLAEALGRRGQLDEAAAMLGEVTQAAVRVLGADDPLVASCAAKLGSVLKSQGRLDEAGQQFERAIEIQSKHFGPEDRENLFYSGELASLRSLQGRLVEAQAIFERVLAARTSLLGPEDASTLVAMGNLALVLKRQGKLEEAGTLWVQELEILERVLGNTHVNTFTTKVNLVFLWYQLGKRDEMEQLFQEVVQDLPHLNGGENLQTLKARDLLAHIRFDQGRLEEAESMLGEAVRIASEGLQLSPLQVAPFQDFQGECLLRLRRFGEAEEVLLKSLAGFETDPGRSGADAETTRARLAALYSAWGKPEEAARYGAQQAAGR